MKPMRTLLLAAALVMPMPALAQSITVDITGGISSPMPIAIPSMPTPAITPTPAGDTSALGKRVAEVITNDLRSSGLFQPIGPSALGQVGFSQVTAPDFPFWVGTGAQALVQGFAQANGDGTITVGCYLYDVYAKTEMARQGFVVEPANWRRAAHKCADTVYTRLTGEGPYFDSRVVYVSETGPKTKRIKRLAIMDQDGANVQYLSSGKSLTLTPRLSPNGDTVAFTSYEDGNPQVYVAGLGGASKKLIEGAPMSFAPRFSPDGGTVVFSVSNGGTTNIYSAGVGGGSPSQLTSGAAIDTSPSYAPDGSRIVFESDRGGSPQIYIMGAGGGGAQRISYGEGSYSTPVWAPTGDLIAYTRQSGGQFQIGIMKPDGSGERILSSSGSVQEGPTWAPNGRVIGFFREPGGDAGPGLWSIDIWGRNELSLPTESFASDPSWSPLRA